MEVEMALLPLKLSGSLSERHRALNHSVNIACSNNLGLESIENKEEHTPFDRLFKIDLASKTRNIDYIIKSIKSDDMLYVNRALKSLWILQNDSDFTKIINPEYLEEVLYPQMHFKSVNKMRKWISKNLKGESRNELFYRYYKEKDLNLSFNFLKKCNSEFIFKKSEGLLEQLTPKRLKILSERNALVSKMFYDKLKNNNNLLKIYNKNAVVYFKQLIHILKINPDLYLDLIENYFQEYEFKKLSFAASKFIMQNKKERFFAKSELYTAWFLDTKAIALNLSKDENKEIIYKLAKADYIKHWFSYKTAEPFLEQLDNDSRKLVKKEIFVDSVIKDKVSEWPYPIPVPMSPKDSFNDFYEDEELSFVDLTKPIGRKVMKRRLKQSDMQYRASPMYECCFASRGAIKQTTLLDKLFDEYRFVSFVKTLEELSKRIMTESNPQNRMYMLLVLVSKSAGNNEYLEKFLTFIVKKHLNETNKFRAAIVRSLVKKAFVWRLSPELWQQLLKYSYGLGLDGNKTDLVCIEGLHCVIIRKAILKEDVETQIQSLYFENFNTMKEYKLSTTEKVEVYEYIKEMLLKSAEKEDKPLSQLQKLLQFLKSFNVKLSNCPEIKDIIIKSIKKDPKYFKPLLEALRNSKDFQKELFVENFSVIRNRKMYNYALNYNISVLDLDKLDPLPKETFFKKLSVYFSDDLAPKFATLLERMAVETESHKPVIEIARYLAIVSGKELGKTIAKFETGDEKAKVFSKALKANYHLARADISHLNWTEIGANAVAFMAFNCKTSETKEMIAKLSKWRPSATVAVRLALRNEPRLVPQTLKEVSIHGPVKVLPVGVESLRLKNSNIDYIASWEAIKDLIPKMSELNEKTQKRLIEEITSDLNYIPDNLKARYYETVYKYLRTNFSDETKLVLLAVVNNNVTELSDVVIDAAQYFYEKEFTLEILNGNDYKKNINLGTLIALFTRFVLLSVNAENIDEWFDKVFVPFFEVYKKVSISGDQAKRTRSYNEKIMYEFLESLKYNKAFFKTSAVSILPLLEKITDYLKTFLSVEKYFKIYSYLHFTMLYFKSVQQCLKQKPHVFDEDKKNNEGIKQLATVFGKYIARETQQMVDSYFITIREPYKKYLSDYLNDYFNSREAKNLFVKSIIISILETDVKVSYLMAEYLYCSIFRHEDKDKEVFKKLENCQSMEVLFYLHEETIL